MDPKVSVIVPMFNVDIYLRKCLDSLAAQTLDALEVILVNDGSTDHTGEIAREYVRKYPDRFFYYEEENSGLSAARNFGLSFAHAEYVAFADSDDFVSESVYEALYEAAVRDNADMVCCGYDRIVSADNDPDDICKVKKYRFYAMHHSGHSVRECPSLLIEGSCYAWNKLYRRSLAERFPFPAGQKYEDSAVVYNMLESANRITLVNIAGYFYRVRRAGAITTDPTGITDIFLSMDSLLRHFSQGDKAQFYHDELSYLCFRHLLYARTSQLQCASASFICAYSRKAFSYLNAHFPDWHNNPYLLRDKSLVTPKYEQQSLLYKDCFTYICSLFGRRWIKKFNIVAMLRKRKDEDSIKKAPYILERSILLDIQAAQRQILRVIHGFCQENGLRYYAAEGSLLGAVRHEGFIPWDDDMDLVMPRKDYEALIRLWDKRSISGCVLLCGATYANYYLPFIKIVQNENIQYKTPSRKTPPFFQGLSIDIFPLDAAPGVFTPAEARRLRKIRVTRDMMLYKVKSLRGRTRKFNCFARGGSFRSMASLQARLKKLCTAYEGKDVPCLANLGSSYAPCHETFPREWWGVPKVGKFDDAEVLLPQNGDEILCTIYGAYRELPSEEEQVCKHRYEKVNPS